MTGLFQGASARERTTHTGGTVTLGPDGKPASIVSAQLIIGGGEGGYAGVTAGVGALEGSANAQRLAPLSATMSMTF